jgi:hypothetical protein
LDAVQVPVADPIVNFEHQPFWEPNGHC